MIVLVIEKFLDSTDDSDVIAIDTSRLRDGPYKNAIKEALADLDNQAEVDPEEFWCADGEDATVAYVPWNFPMQVTLQGCVTLWQKE